nr:MAG: YciI family protein [Hyphomicrobiales bacterium]
MSLYVIICIDRPDSLPLRMATREAHLAYVKATTLVQFKLGGPFLSEDGTMNGSMLIVEADDRNKVDAFVKNDPYGMAGLFESVEVRPWKVTVGSLA